MSVELKRSLGYKDGDKPPHSEHIGGIDVQLHDSDALAELVQELRQNNRYICISFNLSDIDSLRAISRSTDAYAEQILNGDIVFVDETPVAWYEDIDKKDSLYRDAKILAENIGSYILPPPSMLNSTHKSSTVFILTASSVLANNPIWGETNRKRLERSY